MPIRLSDSSTLRRPSFWKLIWHLPRLIRLVGRLLRDSRVPAFGKIVFASSIVYLFLPIDLIPDFILPIIGHLDDLVVVLAGLRFLLRQTPTNVLEEHLAQIG
ncbi:MAG: DUF1232 domain-containing protein [candidate division KSB1 bacterium]|nr:DUF1232 domain-containing protein [candidate division KSB1 bacterium]MDZ7365616.1 DUF1232 domain-containing protein [candidate division KSB1 bacterium]MDZ7403308.1 DUF1232 domain-containing protein [candidate division KSB1 bacterium]